MPNCFQCKINVPSINSLGLHFKIAHKTEIFSIYQCGEENCNRTFNQWASLKKHLLKKHTILPNNNQNVTSDLEIIQNEHSSNIDFSSSEEHIVQSNNLDSVNKCSKEFFNDLKEFFNNLKTHIHSQAEIFIAKLCNNSYIPRCYIQTIINDIKQHIFEESLSLLSNKIKDICTAIDVNIEVQNEIDSIFNSIKNSFEHFSTEYKILKHFETCGEYILPKAYLMGYRLEGVKTIYGIQRKHVPVYGQFIPLREILKKFFELPDAFESTISYIQSLKDSQYVSNFIQCPLWKDKLKCYGKDDIVLPLFFIYYDDFEPNNPLGSHCDKLGAVYCAIPCIPPECQSILDNIFLTLLFHSEDRKWFGNEAVFLPLIEELRFLETIGITINTSKGDKKIFFILSLLLGDNLGLHNMMGFVESFNSTYPCRFCKFTKRDTQINCKQNAAFLRSKQNYESDLLMNNVTLSGIKERCVFNKITSFHVTSNYAVDIMHDILEGVCHYDILLILNHFQKNIEHFSLDILNFRLAMFDFGPIDISNRFPQISLDNLKKNKLKMTASEMLCFTKFFGVLIGDLVPQDDKFWQLYILLREILDIVLSKTLTKHDSLLLNQLIYEHNKLYIELSENNLKPKYHHLLHYATVLEMSGPFAFYSSMRFEAKHRSLKKSCYVNMSRKNITKSIATKHQLQLCFRLKARESILPRMKVGPSEILNINSIDYFDLCKDMLSVLQEENCVSNWVEYKGTRYVIGMVLIIDYKVTTGPTFGEITKIFIKDNYPLFLCFMYETVGFNSHIHGYQILKNYEKMVIMSQENLFDPLPIYSHRMCNGELYCILRYCL